MIAFLFPGQGSQAVGMGRGFYETSAAAKAVFEAADEALGFDLSRLVFQGPASELGLTANTQPGVLTASVAAAAACAEAGLRPAIAAGHSLGEYSALVVAGALRFPDAVRVVRKRGEFMQDAVPVGTGAMAAIVGLDVATVQALCAEAARPDQVVEIANFNAPAQIAVAGHRPAVERAVAIAAARGGGRSVLLPVSAPFHCSLMAPAADRLARTLTGVPVADPAIPIVRNVDAGLTRRAGEVKPGLLHQVANPVRWTDSVRCLQDEGATAFVEVGPGRVLTGLVKRILKDSRTFTVEGPEGLEKTLAALGDRA